MKTKEELIDAVIERIKTDLAVSDHTAIAELLNEVRVDRLKGFLPEDQAGEFHHVLDDKLYSIWCTEDVIERGKEYHDVELTEDQAKKILSDMSSNSDATIGVNWDSISCFISDFIEDMEEEGTPVKEWNGEESED